jgi:aminopeptidase YwaD
MRILIAILCFFSFGTFFSQDTSYARSVINFLTSNKCFGRGYIGKTQAVAADFLAGEFRKSGVKKLLKKSYFQTFDMPVNTFPGKMEVIADGKKLLPGIHFLIGAESQGIRGGFMLYKFDSLTYRGADAKNTVPLEIKLDKKLTWTVSQQVAPYTLIHLLRDSFPNQIKNIDLQIENKFIPAFKSKNICGYIEGTEVKDTFIVLSAHYDHLGGMGKETCFPGANDNASGVSMLLDFAKYFSVHKPKYSVAFLLFAGEEAGLVGSKYFTENPLIPLGKIKFLLNLDLLGTGTEGITVVNATEYKTEFEKLKQINTEKKLLTLIKPRGKAANSDHYWFSEKGVKSFFIYTMGGITAYHDIYDISLTLPLSRYREVFALLTEFVGRL